MLRYYGPVLVDGKFVKRAKAKKLADVSEDQFGTLVQMLVPSRQNFKDKCNIA